MKKNKMRNKFWACIIVGFIVIFVGTGCLFLSWTAVHYDHSNQTMIQAVYLSELSGCENNLEPNDSQLETARQLVMETQTLPNDRLNPELLLVVIHEGAKEREPGSYILQLHRSHPEAINRTLEGSIEPAKELCALYQSTVGLRWLPHGVTLLIIFCVGLFVVFIVALENLLSLFKRTYESMESYLRQEYELIDKTEEEREDESADEPETGQEEENG